jgi:glycosyltransferase involved in cell wall biosynthesis
MYVIVQIPCLNEAETLPVTLASLPRAMAGVDRLEVLIIDDGSTDGTAAVARALGAQHVVRLPTRQGLAAAFQAGVSEALGLGADVIVNTDGDNQYPGGDIARLVAPILAGEADVVIGDRNPTRNAEASLVKRFLQGWGSWVVQAAAGVRVADATSGFRAFTREAALRLNLFTRYTYTLEMIIQAAKKGQRVAFIPVDVNTRTRQSRLIRSNWDYVKRSAATIVRLHALYEPLRTFGLISLPFVIAGLVLLGRAGLLYFTGQALGVARNVQSILVGSTALILGFLIFLFGVLADLTAANRYLLEEVLYRVKRLELTEAGTPPERHPAQPHQP